MRNQSLTPSGVCQKKRFLKCVCKPQVPHQDPAFVSDYPGRRLLSNPLPGSPSRSSVGGSRTSSKTFNVTPLGLRFWELKPPGVYKKKGNRLQLCVKTATQIRTRRLSQTTPDGTSSRTLHPARPLGVLWGVRAAHPWPRLQKSLTLHPSGTYTLLYYQNLTALYIYIYLYIYILIYIYTYTYIYLYIYIYMCVYV